MFSGRGDAGADARAEAARGRGRRQAAQEGAGGQTGGNEEGPRTAAQRQGGKHLSRFPA